MTGECTERCVCCEARVVALPRTPLMIEHGTDRLSGEPCPRAGWPVRDAIATDDEA